MCCGADGRYSWSLGHPRPAPWVKKKIKHGRRAGGTDTVMFTVLDGDAELVLGEGAEGDAPGLCEIELVCVVLSVAQE